MTGKTTIRVAAGIVDNGEQYLIAQRLQGARGEGAWEFPGGKIEHGESSHDALVRELAEEIGILVVTATPMMALRHEYPERFVELEFFHVSEWEGKPAGCEGQQVRWCAAGDLAAVDWLPANAPVVDALLALNKC